MSRRCLALLATCLCWATVTASSQAAVTFQAEGPSSLSLPEFPGDQTVTYTLRMVSGADPERFSVGLELPTLNGPDGSPSGLSISQFGFPTLAGPGTIEGATGVQSSLLPTLCGRGLGVSIIEPRISLPPFSDTRLSARFRVAAGPPLVGDSYVPTFVATSNMGDGTAGTIGPDQRLTPPEPFVGPLGVRLSLRVNRATASVAGLRRGVRIRFAGGTDPAAANQVIRIWFRRLGDRAPDVEGTIARVRTDARGQFRWPAKKAKKGKKRGWKPKKPGGYFLYASLEPRSTDIGPSTSCGRGFALTKQP
jgi:hypothetical protein